jgi:dipeptidyl aminopeptidase/acylaminoacyl peptidase
MARSSRSAPRAIRPDDLYRLRIATDPRLAPDGSRVAFTLQTVAPAKDGYRHAIWAVDTADRSKPRRLTIGARHDTQPRFSPDGQTLAFLSDRRLQVEEEPGTGDAKEREDGQQVHLLPLDGGEATRLTDLPRGVRSFAWSPDGTRLVVLSSSHAATREDDLRRRGKARKAKPGQPPPSDYHFLDRLGYLLNGAGFTYHQVAQLWIVDVATGAARRLTDEPAGAAAPIWSPDSRRIVYTTNLRRDHDLEQRSHLVVIDVESGARTRLTGDAAILFAPTWLPDGRAVAAFGGYLPDSFYRFDVWLIAADGSDGRSPGGRNLSGRHDLMLSSSMSSDIVPGEDARLVVSADGRWITFQAPRAGSMELFRIAVSDGSVEQLTSGHHYISAFDQVQPDRADTSVRSAWLRSSPTELADVWLREGASGAPRRLTDLNAEVLDEVELRLPIERSVTVDGREIQGWFLPAADGTTGAAPKSGRRGRAADPVVTEIHGGPHTLYGWSPILEFQILAASGIGVFFSNPRGSEGYGRAFNEANLRDWGPGPMRDVLAGVESLVADGLADPARLGVTGGSYGGYLTNWIVAHDDRFAAAMTCRSVSDVAMLMLTGDISSGFWASFEFGAKPWDDPAIFREASPITYAHRIRTPLLIQHSENDLRTTIGQAEALFTVVRSHKQPVRLLRVPEETHELTRSGTPFRRVENLVVVRDWFRHFLVDGKRGLPPMPKIRAGT